MRPELVVFDLDGTLVDSAADIRKALNLALASDGLPGIELEAVRLMIGRGPEVLLRRALRRGIRGAQEIDMVIHVSAIKSKHYILVFEDIQQVVKACGDTPVKVIIETALLTETEKVAACTLAKVAGARFITAVKEKTEISMVSLKFARLVST